MTGREAETAKFGAGAGNNGGARAATGEFEPDVGIMGGLDADEGATAAEEAAAAAAGGSGGGDANGRG